MAVLTSLSQLFLTNMFHEQKTLRFVCISDTHSMHENLILPSGDVLLHAGGTTSTLDNSKSINNPGAVLTPNFCYPLFIDFTNTGTFDEVNEFHQWISNLSQYRHKIIIGGNHDITLDIEYYNEVGRDRFHRRSGAYNAVAIKSILTNSTEIVYLEDSSYVIPGTNISVYGSPWQPEFCKWAFNLPRCMWSRQKMGMNTVLCF